MTARQALESTYRDMADVYRRVNVKDPDTGQTRQEEERVAHGVRCALSRNQDRGALLTTDSGYGRTDGVYTLFCPPDTDVREGDRLDVATEAGQAVSLRTGRPFVYVSHMEISMKEAKRA